MLFSPNDLAKCFKLFKHLFNTVTFESCSVENAEAWPVGVTVHHTHFDISPASKKAYWKLLVNLPWIVDKGFVMKTIQDGWRLSGFFPKVQIFYTRPVHLLRTRLLQLRRQAAVSAAQKVAKQLQVARAQLLCHRCRHCLRYRRSLLPHLLRRY